MTAAEPARPGVARSEGRSDDRKPENELLRRIWELLDQATDLSSEEKSEAFDILEEADPILMRIKRENAAALEMLKEPPGPIAPPAPQAEPQQPAAPPAAE
jgi:hypothetical protein